MVLPGVYKGILNGVHQRGEGGFLYVRADHAAYIFPSELKNQNDLRDALQDMLQDEAAQHVYYVVEEKDGKGHVLAYPRAVVRDAVEKEYGRLHREGEGRIVEDQGDSL
jgi:hypothetical protein